jgi:ABC-type multidrug transport system ATPase subunit
LLNGQSVSPSQLRDRVAYVQCDSRLSPDLSVRQALSLHHWLCHSSGHHSKLSTKDRVSLGGTGSGHAVSAPELACAVPSGSK